MTTETMRRCDWCGSDPLYVAYHDREWGVPCRNEERLFEFLVLESMQAGLSWITILRKREHFRRAFVGFDACEIARFDDRDRARLLADAGIVRNRAKIDATIGNARAVLALREGGEGLSGLLWSMVDGVPIRNRHRGMDSIPATTPLSDELSRRLRAAGLRFVGPTICYALMQAVGMVNDHLVQCPRHAACAALAESH